MTFAETYDELAGRMPIRAIETRRDFESVKATLVGLVGGDLNAEQVRYAAELFELLDAVEDRELPMPPAIAPQGLAC